MDNKSGEVQTHTNSGVFICGLRIPPKFSPCKTQSPVSSPQASPKVEANDRPKQAQHLSACRKVQMETPESIRTCLIPGEWVSSIDLSVATFTSLPEKPKEVPDTVLRMDDKSGEVRTQNLFW